MCGCLFYSLILLGIISAYPYVGIPMFIIIIIYAIFTSDQPRYSYKTCPYCGSTHTRFIYQQKEDFSFNKACLGGCLLGWPGTLFGLLGKPGKKEYFCENCGRSFFR